ncbi:hypothetical protein KC19_2G022100 [Ceratodon purpureus]|uniref:RING-type E3 ubiquitin transferase n=1 Tax=Ceratodon purpureus TaxID=3225 RepID=A0A8T0IRY8_CERPU|nr:hypothetical protein KC19_2G022100 [Ceratodon purpureus]
MLGIESAMDMRVCGVVKLWLLLHVVAWSLQSCFSMEIYNPEISDQVAMPPVASREEREYHEKIDQYFKRKYYYVHNETHIAMARAEAEAARHDGDDAAGGNGTTSPLLSIHVPGLFPDFPPSEDGCNWESGNRNLSHNGPNMDPRYTLYHDYFTIVAVDSCAKYREIYIGSQSLELCSHRWVNPEKPDILIRDNPDPMTRSFNVLVRLDLENARHNPEWRYMEILADGVYFPATGKMHLVGCTRKNHRYNEAPPFQQDEATPPETMTDSRIQAPAPVMFQPLVPDQSFEPLAPYMFQTLVWVDPDTEYLPPLNSSTPEDCAISVTLQYPPLNARWNWDRVLKYDIRSKRKMGDPLYFEPVERSAFFPYSGRYYDQQDQMLQLQRRTETGGRILLLVLGLVCLALQIQHGRNNEEALPFVSLVMLGIQLANHLSQTSIFQDLQIGEYRYGGPDMITDRSLYEFQFPDYVPGYLQYYGIMAWSKHVPYQAMAMTAIFMYVWIIHRVGDRRRIMKLRVLKKRPGAKDAPSDWRVMYAILAFFSVLCFLGFFAIGADRYGGIRRAITGMTVDDDRYYARNISAYEERMSASSPGVAAPVLEVDFEMLQPQRSSPFVSWRFYELSHAHWSFLNKLTGLVVSFFLVPQLIGNMQWELQGRPLSAWFYIGIPFLQSLPHIFSIANHFNILPIFSFYDPYINSIYGIYENPTPWWQIGVVVCSAVQVLIVHAQFSRALIDASWRSNSKSTSHVQSCDML